MKQATAAIVVLAALAAATGQDTVKLPDADFWVVTVRPFIFYPNKPGGVTWSNRGPGEYWPNKAATCDQWTVSYALPGGGKMREARLRTKRIRIPTREQVRRAVRMDMLKKDVKATRTWKEVQDLVGRYRRSELRSRSPSTTTRPSSTRPTAPGSGRRRLRAPGRAAQ